MDKNDVDKQNCERTQQSRFTNARQITGSGSFNRALHDSYAVFKDVSSIKFLTEFPDVDYSQMLKPVATLIASREQRGTDCDVFYVRFGDLITIKWVAPSLIQVAVELKKIQAAEDPPEARATVPSL
jgi:hypothetical protein